MSSSARTDHSSQDRSGQFASSRPLRPAGTGVARDRGLRFVLLAVFAAQLWTLARLEGYQLADSVEYMDRAWDIARGYGVGQTSQRSFAFSALLLPFFAIAEWLELEDLRPIVTLLRFLQMGIGLCVVRVVVRTAKYLHSPPIGWASGLLLGLSPVFLQYTIAPLSGPVAMLFMLLGFEALFAPTPDDQGRGELARGIRTGCWFGLGLLVAYQTMLVAGPLLLLGALRDRLQRPRYWLGLIGCYLAFGSLQGLLDLVIYGSFGSTLLPYLRGNIGGVITRVLWEFGLEEQAGWVYIKVVEFGATRTDALDPTVTATQLQSPSWYLLEAPRQLLAWPILALVSIGLMVFVRRPSWARAAIVLTVAANLALMSFKGAKSFRLWLPFLPLIALAAGDGLAALTSLAASGRIRHGLRAVAGVLLGTGLVWGLFLVKPSDLRRFGDFWRAMDTVNRHARDFDTPVKVASSFHWATLFRARSGAKQVKLTSALDHWPVLDEDHRDQLLAELDELDFLITHQQAIQQDPRLMDRIGSRFLVESVYWDEDSSHELGPVVLFVSPRSELPLKGRRLFEYRENVDASGIETILSQLQHPVGLSFERPAATLEGATAAAPLALVFLGWELEPEPAGDALAWVTYLWWAREVDGRDYRIRDRITDNLAREAWNNDARAYGVFPTSTWTAKGVLTERYLIRIPTETRQYGGPYARGELIPAELYLSVQAEASVQADSVQLDGQPAAGEQSTPSYELSIFGPRGRELVPPRTDTPRSRESYRPIGPAGWRWNESGMIRAGAAWLPVSAAARFPTDGGAP